MRDVPYIVLLSGALLAATIGLLIGDFIGKTAGEQRCANSERQRERVAACTLACAGKSASLTTETGCWCAP
jgi:hypothetical protein